MWIYKINNYIRLKREKNEQDSVLNYFFLND